MGIEGIDKTRRLAADLRGAAAGAPMLASMAVKKATFDIEAHAKEIAPFRFGFLKNSINSDFSSSNAYVAVGRVGPTANYGAFLEFGTHKMAPRPYMGPATDAVEPLFNAAMQQIADRTL